MEFKFENNEGKSPVMYIGAKLEYQIFKGIKCWTMSSDKYVNAAIENIEKKLKSEGRHLPRRADTPMSSRYRTEEDVSAEGDRSYILSKVDRHFTMSF
jgi:hypothetical protein